MKKFLLAIATIFAFGVSAFAQTPDTFKYQALVKNDDGTPLKDTEVSVRVKIHQTVTDGDILFSETQSCTTTGSGILFLNIGEGENNVSLTDLNWADGPYFIEVEIDKGNGFVSTGIQQMVSVPYAQYANNAQKVTLQSPNGKTWEVTIDDNGQISTKEVTD